MPTTAPRNRPQSSYKKLMKNQDKIVAQETESAGHTIGQNYHDKYHYFWVVTYCYHHSHDLKRPKHKH